MTNSASKDIAVIRSTFSPYGGAETMALDLIHAILNAPCRVHLLTTEGQNWQLNHAALTIVPLPIHSKQRLLEAWSFERAVNNFLNHHRFDIVFSIDRVTSYTHLHAGGGTHKAFLAAKNHASSLAERLFRKTSLFHRYILHLERKGFRNPSLRRIHCCSRMVANDIRNDYQLSDEKLQVIYNGIRWEEIGEIYRNRRDVAGRLCREENLDPRRNWILFLGSGFRRKGLDIALQGLSALPTSYHLLVVGSGKVKPIRKAANRMGLDSRVRILGPRPNGWRYAALCRAMVLPSRYEPFGLAAAESQAMGLPVLVSDRTGFGELIEEGVSGVRLKLIQDVTSIHDAFQKLVELVDNPALSSDEIRSRTQHLDNRNILDRMVHEFLEL